LVIGGVAGWLAGYIMKGSGFGVIGNIIVGMIGGFIGGGLLSLVNIGMLAGVLLAGGGQVTVNGEPKGPPPGMLAPCIPSAHFSMICVTSCVPVRSLHKFWRARAPSPKTGK